ncbi:hypothetical protein [Sphingobacterium sp. GVS05A]|uniref:hypothetical protein n=1 Tax=Sphingobacterium sp. GVS05A TaxID=2862679 RepID=UPI001CBC51A2|nr:hypothetical protein [Sphingobacterium sp. GVS05A]
MRPILLIIFILFIGRSGAQTTEIPDRMKSAFTGKWEYKTRFQTNTVVIWFEPGKEYASFKDIGSGEAPPRTFRPQLKGNVLFIPAKQGLNDELEMEVVKGKLNLRVKPIIWDETGNIVKTGTVETRIFKRTTKEK